MAIQLPRKQTPISSIAISLDDVRKIYNRLLKHVHEQGDREVAQLVRPDGQDEMEFEAQKEQARSQAFRVTVTIGGADGESLYGESVEIFDSPNVPDVITSIYMTNVTAYQQVSGRQPINSFELYFDFSKPPLLDGSNLVSSPTPNSSKLTMQGDRDSWVASISDAVMAIIEKRHTKRSWIHRAFVYDIGLLVVGIPAGLYVCWKLSDPIQNYTDSISTFLSTAMYLYIFLVIVWAYRIFFGYTKWAFPSVELGHGLIMAHPNTD